MASPRKRPPTLSKAPRPRTVRRGPPCELCGKVGPTTRTDCCGRRICDDEDSYVLFSFAHNSCARNHRRFTLCGHHATEGHNGSWQSCRKCRDAFDTEMYVYYGTNDYNFETLPDPPAFRPTHCHHCGARIALGYDSYSRLGTRITCASCTPGC